MSDKQDAARYRWLKSRRGLRLQSEPQPNIWTRPDGTTFSATHSLAEGGTSHGAAPDLDSLIDSAILVAAERDGREEEPMELFSKTYDSGSIVDIGRDVPESLDSSANGDDREENK